MDLGLGSPDAGRASQQGLETSREPLAPPHVSGTEDKVRVSICVARAQHRLGWWSLSVGHRWLTLTWASTGVRGPHL